MIKGAGPHPDQYFMRTYDRVWSILILQDLRTTVLVESNRFHDLSFHGSLLVPFQLFMATLPFRAVATIVIREAAKIRHIKLERH
jgi:hypothetical protein